MAKLSSKEKDDYKKTAAETLGSGPIILVVGILFTLGGFFFIGLPLAAVGGVMMFVGVDRGARLAADSEAGRNIAAGARSAAAALKAEAEKSSIRSRAGKVIAGLHEQLQAGAISQAEYDQRVAQVNEKLNADVLALESRA